MPVILTSLLPRNVNTSHQPPSSAIVSPNSYSSVIPSIQIIQALSV